MVERGKDLKPEDRRELRERRAMRKLNTEMDLPNFAERPFIPTARLPICSDASKDSLTPETLAEVWELLRQPSFETWANEPPFPLCKTPPPPNSPNWSAARAGAGLQTTRRPLRTFSDSQITFVRSSSDRTLIGRDSSSGKHESTGLRSSVSTGRLPDMSS